MRFKIGSGGWGCIFFGWVDISQVKGLDYVGTLSVPRGSTGWGFAQDFCMWHYSHNDKYCISVHYVVY